MQKISYDLNEMVQINSFVSRNIWKKIKRLSSKQDKKLHCVLNEILELGLARAEKAEKKEEPSAVEKENSK